MLRLLDGNFNVLGVITGVISSIWNVRFYEAGTFEIHLAPDVPFSEYLKIDTIIQNEGFTGIIEYIKLTDTEIVLTGYDMKGLMKRRMCRDTASTGTTMTAQKWIAFYFNNLNNSAAARNIDFFKTGAVATGTDVIKITADIQKTVDEAVTELCKEYEIGVLCTVVGKYVRADVINPTKNENVKFCQNRKTIGAVKYIQDTKDYKNFCYYSVEGSANPGTYYSEKKEPSGITRRETYAEDYDEAEDVLQEAKSFDSVEAETQAEGWSVGDIVTVEFEAFGELYSAEKIITEAEYVFEAGTRTATPTLGEKKDSIIKKLLSR